MSDIQYAHEPSSAAYDYQISDQWQSVQQNTGLFSNRFKSSTNFLFPDFQLPIYDQLSYDVNDGFAYEHPKNKHISLKDSQLWAEFHAITNEMLVVRGGRTLFPKLACEFKELCKDVEYVVGVRMMLQSPNKWKYIKDADKSRRWIANSAEERVEWETNEVFTGVMSGEMAMKEGFDMSRIKIFNLGSRCTKKEQDTDKNMVSDLKTPLSLLFSDKSRLPLQVRPRHHPLQVRLSRPDRNFLQCNFSGNGVHRRHWIQG